MCSKYRLLRWLGIDGCLIELGEALITEWKISRFAGGMYLASAGLAESGSPSFLTDDDEVFKYINLKHMTCLTEKDAKSSMAYPY
jgi:hypothetical protein